MNNITADKPDKINEINKLQQQLNTQQNINFMMQTNSN